MVGEVAQHAVHNLRELASLLADVGEVHSTLRVVGVLLDGHLIGVALIVQIGGILGV